MRIRLSDKKINKLGGATIMPTLHNESSAYKLEYYDSQEEKKQVIDVKKNKKNLSSSKSRGKVFLGVVLCLVVSFVILWRYTMIIEANNQVKNLQNELTRLQRETEQVKIELDSLVDLECVERIAREELGMRRPENYQTVYVEVNTSDYAQVLEKTQELSKTQNVFRLLFNEVNKVLAYLY